MSLPRPGWPRRTLLWTVADRETWVWRASVGLEMACLGLPVIVSGRARYRNYVDLPYTRSKKHFRDQIDGAAEIEITPEAQTSASIYLHFEKTQRHIPIPYVQNVDYNEFRPSELRWNRQAVDDFLEDGDQHLESRIVSEVNYEKGENSEFPFNR